MARCRYCGKEVHKGKHQHEEYCPNNPDHKTAKDRKNLLHKIVFSDTLKDAWGFWNKCFLGRTRIYQPRQLEREELAKHTGTKCPRCGKMSFSLVYMDRESLFDWRAVPGEDEKEVLHFLSRKYCLNLSNAKFEKSYISNNIKITDGTKEISLRFNKYTDTVYLEINGKKVAELHVRKKDHKLIVYDEGGYICHKCKIEIERVFLKGVREDIKIKNLEMAEKFQDLLDECQKEGTCDILAAHHELLKEDDERLRTDVMLKFVCKNEYEDRWNEFLDNMNAKLESEKLKIKKSTGKVDEYENSEGQGDYLGTQLRDH